MVKHKVCMIGDFGVGKTSLVRRFVEGVFSPEYQATLGVVVKKRADTLETESGPVEFQHLLWDIEGGLQGGTLLDSYIGGASGAVVVGDQTREDCIEKMEANAQRFRAARPGRPVVFALNKADLVRGNPLEERAKEMAALYGGIAMPTSAATGDAVPELFRTLAHRILTIGA